MCTGSSKIFDLQMQALKRFHVLWQIAAIKCRVETGRLKQMWWWFIAINTFKNITFNKLASIGEQSTFSLMKLFLFPFCLCLPFCPLCLFIFLCRLKTLSPTSRMRQRVYPSELSKASWPKFPVLSQVRKEKRKRCQNLTVTSPAVYKHYL